MSGPTLADHWKMIERERDLPFDFEQTVRVVGSLISLHPFPFAWHKQRLDDGQGNSVWEWNEVLAMLNAVPGLLLELRQRKDGHVSDDLKALFWQRQADKFADRRDEWKARAEAAELECAKRQALLGQLGADPVVLATWMSSLEGIVRAADVWLKEWDNARSFSEEVRSREAYRTARAKLGVV